MSAYVIFDVEIRDMERYQAFMKGVKSALDAAGARYLARGGAHKVYEGDWMASAVPARRAKRRHQLPRRTALGDPGRSSRPARSGRSFCSESAVPISPEDRDAWSCGSPLRRAAASPVRRPARPPRGQASKRDRSAWVYSTIRSRQSRMCVSNTRSDSGADFTAAPHRP
jgi:hypothetical protein